MSIKWLVVSALCSMQLIPYALADTSSPELRPELRTTTTTTTTTTTDQPQSTTVEKSQSFGRLTAKRIRSDSGTARRLAKYHWLDKVAESNPGLIQAIAAHHTAAIILANHPRLGAIAEADHYLCRYLTRWKDVARAMVQNGEADQVVALDPEGIYRVIKRDKATARRLARNPMFDQMVNENPDLGKLIATYM